MKRKRAFALLLSAVLAAALPVGAAASESAPSGVTGAAEEVAEEDPCAEGHDYEKEVVPPTCTEDGEIIWTCSQCGDSRSEKGQDALGHDYKEEITREATEDEEGLKTWTCSRCGDSYTESIPKLKKEDSGKASTKDDSGSGSQEKKDPESKDTESKDTDTKDTESKDTGSRDSDSKDSETGSTSSTESAAESVTTAPAAAGEDEVQNYFLTFNGIAVTSANAGNITGDHTVSFSYSASGTSTLTLKSAEIEYEGSDPLEAVVNFYKADSDLKIQVTGDCSLKGSSDVVDGIRVSGGSLYIEGTGTLEVRGTGSNAIYAAKDVHLFQKTAQDHEDGKEAPGSLTAKGPEAGIKAGQALHVYGGTIHAESSSDKSSAIDAVKNIAFTGGTITVKSSGDIGVRSREGSVSFGTGMRKAEMEAGSAAVKADNKVSLAAVLKITYPEGGAVSDDEKTIAEEAGKDDPAKKATVEAASCKVSFNANGGSGSMEDITTYAGHNLTLPKCTFKPGKCKAFDKWEVGSRTYSAGDKISVTANTVVKALWKDSHTTAYVAKVAATCTTAGHKSHYKCSVCSRLFSNKAATTEITKDSIVIKALGHKWGKVTYTPSSATGPEKVTAKRVCERDNTHVEEETVNAVKTGNAPTCETPGKFTYKATFKNTAFKGWTKTESFDKLGHLWNTPVFTWNTDKTEATALMTCQRDASHTRNGTATVKGMITMPTTSADGKVQRTATVTLESKQYTDTAELVIKPAGTSGYKWVSSTSNITWTKGSSSSISGHIKRDEFDTITFSAYSGITVDGKTVSSSYISKEKGSLKFTLSSSYLKGLSTGTHTLKVLFRDGSAEEKFTVKASSSNNNSSNNRNNSNNSNNRTNNNSSSNNTSNSPRTGDSTNWILWVVIAAVSAAGVAAIIVLKKRGGKQQ